ncbi:hypothetical protein ACIBQ5_31050 [Streptomyces massasporeus]
MRVDVKEVGQGLLRAGEVGTGGSRVEVYSSSSTSSSSSQRVSAESQAR